MTELIRQYLFIIDYTIFYLTHLPTTIQIPKANKLEQAKLFLRELSKNNNMMPSNEIFEIAEKNNISKRTLENAKKELGIKAKKINNCWYWALNKAKAN